MTLPAKIFRGSALLALSEFVTNGCTFARNFILARVLTKADFGIAATLTVVVSLLEIAGRFSLGQQIVRAKQGSERDYVGAAHLAQFVLGLLSAALILVLANSFAQLLRVPDLSWAIQVMALVPLCSALSSLEPFKYIRTMGFGRSVLAEVIPQILITLAAYPVAAWFGDFRALVCLLVAKAFLGLGISHVVSGHRYRWCLRLDYFREMVRFGSPLLVESLLMFGALQGDRLLVGSSFSLSDLGGYAVAGSLAATPVIALWKVAGGVGLPLLASAQDDRARFHERYAGVVQTLALAAVFFGLMMVLVAEPITTLLFGAKYRGIGSLVACLCCAQSLRIVRGAPILAATALGETICLPVMSATRLSGLLFAGVVVWAGGSLFLVACGAIAGEVLAIGVGILMLYRVQGVPVTITLFPAVVVAVALTCAAALKTGLQSVLNPVFWVAGVPLAWLAFTLVFVLLFRQIRYAAKKAVYRVRACLPLPGMRASATQTQGAPADLDSVS